MDAPHPELLAFLRKNTLFDGLTGKQLAKVALVSREINFAAGDYLVRKDQVSEEIYILKEGQLGVVKEQGEDHHSHRLATLEPGAVISEMSLISNSPRTTSVRALQPTTVIVLTANDLRLLSDEKVRYSQLITKLTKLITKLKSQVARQPIYPTLVANLAKNLSKRVQGANEALAGALQAQLDQLKVRTAMGRFIISIVALLSFYVLVEDITSAIKTQLVSSSFISVPLIGIFAVALFVMMKSSGYPLSFYGLTLNNWRQSAWEGIIFTLPLLLVVVIYKWLMIEFDPSFNGRPIFDMHPALLHSIPAWLSISLMILYLAFAPLQELVVRGALQSSLQEFFLGPYRTLWAILISNLLFSITHVHVSLGIGVIVYLPGLFWGWLYARHRNLVGVSISHQLVGAWALFVVGIV